MKTRELKKKLGELGYSLEDIIENPFGDIQNYLKITADGDAVALVSKCWPNVLTTMVYQKEVANNVMDLLVEYARTPIAEREGPTKYRVWIPEISSFDGMLMYLTKEHGRWCTAWFGLIDTKQVFTEAELADAPSWVRRDWWEEVK